jgi:hypothetical protein
MDPGPVTVALVIVVVLGGLVAVHRRLRRAYDRMTTALVVALLAGATPLSSVVLERASLFEAGWFALLSVLLYWSRGARTALAIPLTAVAIPMLAAVVRPQARASALDALFSPDGGFLSLTPVVYVALIGTALQARRALADAAAVLIALTVWPWLGFPLTPALALLAPGLALVIDRARARPIAAVAPLVLAAILWNYWLMVQYTAGTLPKDAPVSFAAMVRQQADVHTRPPYVYPFAFPANVWFAWREGVPVDRYDVLSTVTPGDAFELALDRRADRFLLDGWGPPGTGRHGAFRWIAGPRATLVLPLDAAPGSRALTLLATAQSSDPSIGSVLRLDLQDEPIGTVHVNPSAPADVRIDIPADTARRILRKGYNRLSIVTSGPARVAIHRLRLGPPA